MRTLFSLDAQIEHPHRQAHPLGIVARQDIAKVASRHTEVHNTPKRSSCPQKLAIGRKIVNDLWHKTAPVDGVCAGQPYALFCQCRGHSRVAKDLLYAGLGIIKVSLYCVHCNIGALLGSHLQTLTSLVPPVG